MEGHEGLRIKEGYQEERQAIEGISENGEETETPPYLWTKYISNRILMSRNES